LPCFPAPAPAITRSLDLLQCQRQAHRNPVAGKSQQFDRRQHGAHAGHELRRIQASQKQRQCGQGDEQARDGVGGEEQALPGRSGNHRQRSPRGQPAKHHQHGQQQPATASQEQKQICRRGDQRGQRQARATEGQGDPIAGSGRQ
jgi:hypothetical protein